MAKSPYLDDRDLAWLPAVSLDSRDVLTEMVYVGKAVMKELWMEGM